MGVVRSVRATNKGLNGATVTERLLGIDGRSREAQALREKRDRLLSIVPVVTPAVVELAELGAQVSLHLIRLDAKALKHDGLTDSEAKIHATLSGSFGRIVRALEQMARSTKAPRHGAGTALEQHVARRLAERGAPLR